MMKRYEDAFPPVPELVHFRVEKTLEEIEKMKMPIRTKPRAGLLIAVILILLLAGIAYASSRLGLVDALLQNQMKKNAPSEALLQSIIPLDVSETVGDVKITLNGVAYDGKGLAIGYMCENLAPGTLAMVIYESATANGKPMESREWDYYWVPDAFLWQDRAFGMVTQELPSQNPISKYKIGEFFEDPGAGEWEVKVNFIVKQFPPNVIIVDSDEMRRDSFSWAWDEAANTMIGGAAEAYEARLERIQSFGIPVAPEDERDPDLWVARGYSVINSNGYYYGARKLEGNDTPYFSESQTVEGEQLMGMISEDTPHSPLVEVGIATLTFTFDADQAQSLVEVYEPDLSFPMDVCNVRINRVILSPLKTSVEFDLEPLGDDWSVDAIDKIFDSFGGFTLTDQNGTPLAELGWGLAVPNGEQGGHGAMPLNEEETRWVIRGFCNGPGLYQKPEALRMVTTDTFSPVDDRFRHKTITDADVEAYLRRKEVFDSTVLIPIP